jgi:hypothetical protein
MVRSKVVKREREMLKSVESREMDKTCQQEMFWQSDSKLERHWNWTHNQANPAGWQSKSEPAASAKIKRVIIRQNPAGPLDLP